MPRVLTAVRVTVGPAQETEWLATVHALAARLVSRGMHLWVFRARDEAGAFHYPTTSVPVWEEVPTPSPEARS